MIAFFMINCVDFKARGDRPVADGYLIKISKNKLFFECMAEKYVSIQEGQHPGLFMYAIQIVLPLGHLYYTYSCAN